MNYNLSIEGVITSTDLMDGSKHIMSLDSEKLTLPKMPWRTDYHHELRTALAQFITLDYDWIQPRILEIVTVGDEVSVLMGAQIPHDTKLTYAYWVNIVNLSDPSELKLAANLVRRVS